MKFDISKYRFRSSSLFQQISEEHYKELELIKKTVKLKKGEILYREGDRPKAVYGLVKGKIKIEQVNEEGSQRIVYVYSKDEYFGFRPLLSSQKHPVTAIALENCELHSFEGRKFLRIAKKSAQLSFNLLEILSFEFSVWINLIATLSNKSAKEKIALILLILTEKYGGINGAGEITMSKADIARYAETSEETVVRVIKFFEQKRLLVNSGRKFMITDKNTLGIIAEGY
jgi:CRP-like cAMP-binding protein